MTGQHGDAAAVTVAVEIKAFELVAPYPGVQITAAFGARGIAVATGPSETVLRGIKIWVHVIVQIGPKVPFWRLPPGRVCRPGAMDNRAGARGFAPGDARLRLQKL